MSKIRTLYISFLLTIVFDVSIVQKTNAQTPVWLWAKSAGGNVADYGRSVATDKLGNLYVTGHFENASITFGSITLVNSNPGYSEIFLVKYSHVGNVIWAKRLSGNGTDNAYSISTDLNDNIYLVGDFRSSTLDFDTISLNNAGFADMFIAKYNPAGNVIWAKNANGIYQESAFDVTTDAIGNVLVTGYYGPSINFGSTTLSSSGYEDIFITKYDSTGNVLWAKSAGGSKYDGPVSIKTDAINNVIIAGVFSSPTIAFDTSAIINTSLNNFDIFIAKYNKDGQLIWLKNAGGKDDDFAHSVCVDALNNIIITGFFKSDTISFGSSNLISGGSSDMFLTKYDSTGNVLWTKREGGNKMDAGNSVTIDKLNRIIVAGTFASQSIVIGTDILTNEGGTDLFISMYDANGNSYWAQSAGGNYDDIPLSIVADLNNQIIVTGYYFSSGISFGSNTISHPSSFSFPDLFIAKMDSISISTGMNELSTSNTHSIYPNPSSGLTKFKFSINKSSPIIIEIYSLSGLKLMTYNKGVLPKGEHVFTFDTHKMKSGLYYVHVKTNEHVSNSKFVVVH